jgi:hypothetical protein
MSFSVLMQQRRNDIKAEMRNLHVDGLARADEECKLELELTDNLVEQTVLGSILGQTRATGKSVDLGWVAI